ncbi:hypothetical protein BDZ85DRAFT_2107 [Elsinoe ampelina]|uniref:Uncharacterized protein n=1 Tax=Elsinoe ampelina TaxID=302913 RepID=A0A6A6GNJ3_9PEZI|nr:hypothetical protein BDZ85DRAFT_2107 [Elsinoe ampelina]
MLSRSDRRGPRVAPHAVDGRMPLSSAEVSQNQASFTTRRLQHSIDRRTNDRLQWQFQLPSYWSVPCPFPQFRRGDSRCAFRSRIQWLTSLSYQIQTSLSPWSLQEGQTMADSSSIHTYRSRLLLIHKPPALGNSVTQPSYQWRGPFRPSSLEQTPRLEV